MTTEGAERLVEVVIILKNEEDQCKTNKEREIRGMIEGITVNMKSNEMKRF